MTASPNVHLQFRNGTRRTLALDPETVGRVMDWYSEGKTVMLNLTSDDGRRTVLDRTALAAMYRDPS